MQTLLDMGSNQNSTIVFPIPIELIRPLLAAPVPMKAAASASRAVTNGDDGPAAVAPGRPFSASGSEPSHRRTRIEDEVQE
jgi:hypothetical protein